MTVWRLSLLALCVACSEYAVGKAGDDAQAGGTGQSDTAAEPGSGSGSSGSSGGDGTGGGTGGGSTGGDAGGESGTGAGTGGSTGGASGSGDDGDADRPDPSDENAFCEWAADGTGRMDDLQTPGDGRVSLCHNDGGPNWGLNTISISACV